MNAAGVFPNKLIYKTLRVTYTIYEADIRTF